MRIRAPSAQVPVLGIPAADAVVGNGGFRMPAMTALEDFVYHVFSFAWPSGWEQSFPDFGRQDAGRILRQDC